MPAPAKRLAAEMEVVIVGSSQSEFCVLHLDFFCCHLRIVANAFM